MIALVGIAVLAVGYFGYRSVEQAVLPRVLDRSVIDDVVAITDVAASRMQERLAREEGISAGVS